MASGRADAKESSRIAAEGEAEERAVGVDAQAAREWLSELDAAPGEPHFAGQVPGLRRARLRPSASPRGARLLRRCSE